MQAARNYSYQTAMNPQQHVGEVSVKRAPAKYKRISPNHKSTMFRVVFLCAILLIVMIGLTAYGVQIKYAINQVNDEIDAIQSQIDTLNLEISQQMSPATIESRATEMGMVRPNRSQQVYLEGNAAPNVAIANANK